MKDSLFEAINNITDIKKNADIGSNSWIGCGGKAEYLIIPKSMDELSQALIKIHKIDPEIKINIIGARSNTIVRDGLVSGITIWLRKGFNEIKLLQEDMLEVGCGTLDITLANTCLEYGISGMEFLVGIPGTLGGNIRMNAGCYGREIKDILIGLEYMDFKGNIMHIPASDIVFEYRKMSLPHNVIFTKAVLKGYKDTKEAIASKMNEIEKKRKSTQPVGHKTVGSTFKNPRVFTLKSMQQISSHFSAEFPYSLLEDGNVYCDKIHSWMLIDACNLRGYSLGGAQVSDLHCNFLVNTGGATATDFEMLGEYVIKAVFEKFGVTLEWEVERIGNPTT